MENKNDSALKEIKVVVALFVKYVNEKPYFLIGLRDNNRPGGLLWEFPGGKVDPLKDIDGNDILDDKNCIVLEPDFQALMREMREELNVDIRVNDLIWHGIDQHLNISMYHCDLLNDDFKLSAHIEVCWRNIEHISKLKNTVWVFSEILPVLKKFEKN